MLTTIRRKLELDLTNLIKAISYWEIQIENVKISMSENHALDVYYCFQLINNSNKAHLTELQFHNFLSANRINCSDKECGLVWQQLYNQQDVSVDIFCDSILPSTDEKIRQYYFTKRSQQPSTHDQLFNKDSLVNLFRIILQAQRQLSDLKQDIARQESDEVWRIVNEKNHNFTGNVSRDAFFLFIKGNGAQYTNDEWRALLRAVHCRSERDHVTQSEFNQLVQPARHVMISNKFTTQEINSAVEKKMIEYGVKPMRRNHDDDKTAQNGSYGFRKVFDPIREGRPQFLIDEQYFSQLNDYKERYVAPSRNHNLMYHHNPNDIGSHDKFFQDYYVHLHQRDQEELFYNRFGRQYVYDSKI